jgi:PAS domain S-box-containing protein
MSFTSIQQSRDRYQALFDGAPIGYLVLDPEGRVVEANRTATTLLQTEREVLVGRRLQLFLPDPEDVRGLNQHLERTFACREPQECELAFRQGTAGFVHVRLHSQAVSSPSRPSRCRTALIDVSTRKRAEDALRQVNEDLVLRTRSLEASLQAAQLLERRLVEAERLEAIGRLAGGVAHDFNNMLTVIIGVAEVELNRLPPDHATRRALEQILLAGERSAKLTGQLLAFGRRQLLTPELVDLAALVEETCSLLATTIGPTVRVGFTPPPERVAAKADPMGLQQALVNLALNARDAMPEGGSLQLSLRNLEIEEEAARQPGARPRRYAVLSVRDDGVGLDPESRERIFEPFFTTKERGAGLGLASVHGFVSQSGGFITVDSAPSRGTTFHIHLPAVRMPPEQSSGESLQESSSRSLGGGVLLVDDEPLLRDLFAGVLSDAGLEVVAAGSGEEALKLCRARQQPFDLAVLDVLMPGMTGVELAERLRELAPDCQVVFMSGFAAEDLVQRIGRDIEGPLLQKPLSSERLLLEVQRALTP